MMQPGVNQSARGEETTRRTLDWDSRAAPMLGWEFLGAVVSEGRHWKKLEEEWARRRQRHARSAARARTPRRGNGDAVVQLVCLFGESGKRNSTVALESWKKAQWKNPPQHSAVQGCGENDTGVGFRAKERQSRGSHKSNAIRRTPRSDANYAVHHVFKSILTMALHLM